MSLDEKIAQLGSHWHTPFFDEENFGAAAENLMKDGIGTISWLLPSRKPDDNVVVMNKIQKYAVEETRLGIPVLFHGEALAGGLFYGATYFPTAIGLASTWDPELIGRMTGAITRQMHAAGIRIVFSPVLDIARDPRWGRIGETYGEDPYLASQIGKAFVKGMQGDDLTQATSATGKHFLAYGSGEGGRNKAVVNVGKRELVEIYARPFEAVIRDAKVRNIMNMYGVIDNVPVPGSPAILTDLLKNQLGFEGLVVSDYGAVGQLLYLNRSAADREDAAVQAITAGIDVEQPDLAIYLSLKDAVGKGKIAEEVIDRSVRKVLKLKFELGLFENPYAPGHVAELVSDPRNRELSYQAAIKSMVLLKNENQLLPLSRELSSIAVIGPNSDQIRSYFGGYSSVALREITQNVLTATSRQGSANKELSEEFGDENKVDGFARYFYPDSASVLEAVRQVVSPGTRVNYARGCELTGTSTEGFAEAVDAVNRSEIALVVLGGMEGMGKNTTCGEGKDTVDITLTGVQEKLLEDLHKTGKPIVLVVINSRPLAIPWAAANIPAIVQAWTPGERGGQAIADILFGKAAPGGKLPVTFLRNVGQVPLYYNRKPIYGDLETYAIYIDGNNTCLYPFGHGLSYTEFTYSDLAFAQKTVDTRGYVTLSFTLANTGARTGEEVAQVYIRDREADVARPVKELAGFRRVRLEPGQSCRLTFEITLDQMAFYNKNMDFVVEPGNMDVMIGSSAEDIRLRGEFQITGEPFRIAGGRSFSARVSEEFRA